MVRTLIVKQKFSSAHFLENYNGKCEKMHGHTFEVEVHIKADKLDSSGIAIDFTEIKKFLKDILPDHKVLNEIYDFSPSAENVSEYLYKKIGERFPVLKVVVWESENAAATFGE